MYCTRGVCRHLTDPKMHMLRAQPGPMFPPHLDTAHLDRSDRGLPRLRDEGETTTSMSYILENWDSRWVSSLRILSFPDNGAGSHFIPLLLYIIYAVYALLYNYVVSHHNNLIFRALCCSRSARVPANSLHLSLLNGSASSH